MKHAVEILHPQVAGLGRKHQHACTCGDRGPLTADLDEAKRSGQEHVAGATS